MAKVTNILPISFSAKEIIQVKVSGQISTTWFQICPPSTNTPNSTASNPIRKIGIPTSYLEAMMLIVAPRLKRTAILRMKYMRVTNLKTRLVWESWMSNSPRFLIFRRMEALKSLLVITKTTIKMCFSRSQGLLHYLTTPTKNSARPITKSSGLVLCQSLKTSTL